MLVLTWLGLQPKQTKPAEDSVAPSSYLVTGGAEIHATATSPDSNPLHLEPGGRLALSGGDTYRKHFFCDWILGFIDIPGNQVCFQVEGRSVEKASERTHLATVLGRSPLLYGETIRESLLYRTNHVRKQDLYQLIERLYGPSLRARTNAQNPLFGVDGKPVPTQVLTAREHLEIAQINLILQKTPLVVLDLSSELMTEALNEGFRPCAELLESGKTIIAILPTDKGVAWAEEILGKKFSASLNFT